MFKGCVCLLLFGCWRSLSGFFLDVTRPLACATSTVSGLDMVFHVTVAVLASLFLWLTDRLALVVLAVVGRRLNPPALLPLVVGLGVWRVFDELVLAGSDESFHDRTIFKLEGHFLGVIIVFDLRLDRYGKVFARTEVLDHFAVGRFVALTGLGEFLLDVLDLHVLAVRVRGCRRRIIAWLLVVDADVEVITAFVCVLERHDPAAVRGLLPLVNVSTDWHDL